MEQNSDLMARLAREDSEGAAAAAIYNSEHVQRSKLRIDTRLKLLAKWNPKKYGDRQVIAGDPEAPLGGLSEQQVDDRLAALMAKMS